MHICKNVSVLALSFSHRYLLANCIMPVMTNLIATTSQHIIKQCFFLSDKYVENATPLSFKGFL